MRVRRERDERVEEVRETQVMRLKRGREELQREN